MAKVKEPFNPFYAVLLVASILFSISACAYGVMAFTAMRNGPIVAGPASGQRLLVFLDVHGSKLLTAELILLAIATVGVMAWDQRATPRATAQQTSAQDDGAEAPTKTQPGEPR